MRIQHDVYPTENGVIDVLWPYLREAWEAGCRITEPAAGEGALAAGIARWNPTAVIVTNDIRPVPGVSFVGDATSPNAAIWRVETDVVITNPPYEGVSPTRIIENALSTGAEAVAMLLRFSYLEPAKSRRHLLIGSCLHDVVVLNPRPKFRSDKKGSDQVTAAWFVWRKDYDGKPQVSFAVDWR
jgi:hypothetical protein